MPSGTATGSVTTSAPAASGEAAEIAGDDLSRNDARIRVGECDRQIGEGDRERELYGRRIDGGDVLDRADIGARRRGRYRIEDRLEGCDDILRRQRRAIVERQARTKLEGPFGQSSGGFRIDAREQRVNHGRTLVDRDPQHAASLWRLGRERNLRQGAERQRGACKDMTTGDGQHRVTSYESERVSGQSSGLNSFDR